MILVDVANLKQQKPRIPQPIPICTFMVPRDLLKLRLKVLNNCFQSFYHRGEMSGPIESSITAKITDALSPTHLQVINESTMHNVPAGSETHFKVVVVSNEFENKSALQRHRIVNTLLDDELNNGVHALSIVTRTPKQWEESDQKIEPSPNCKGGFGK